MYISSMRVWPKFEIGMDGSITKSSLPPLLSSSFGSSSFQYILVHILYIRYIFSSEVVNELVRERKEKKKKRK